MRIIFFGSNPFPGRPFRWCRGERSHAQRLFIVLSSENKIAPPLARLTLCGKLTAKICPATWAPIKHPTYPPGTVAMPRPQRHDNQQFPQLTISRFMIYPLLVGLLATFHDDSRQSTCYRTVSLALTPIILFRVGRQLGCIIGSR